MGRDEQVFLGEQVRLPRASKPAQARLRVRFMLLGLVFLAALAWPNQAGASCGSYVIIGRPSPEAAEQARMRREWMPLEEKQAPCNGPQCRKQDRPMNPAPVVTMGVHDLAALTLEGAVVDENEMRSGLSDEDSFISDPHIWRIDPPPRF